MVFENLRERVAARLNVDKQAERNVGYFEVNTALNSESVELFEKTIFKYISKNISYFVILHFHAFCN